MPLKPLEREYMQYVHVDMYVARTFFEFTDPLSSR